MTITTTKSTNNVTCLNEEYYEEICDSRASLLRCESGALLTVCILQSMVRSYSRHGPVEAFGTIATNLSNSLFDGKVAWVPANEDVIVCEWQSWSVACLRSVLTIALQGI